MASWHIYSLAFILSVLVIIANSQVLPPSTDPPFKAPLKWDKQQISEKYPDPKIQFSYCKQSAASSFCDPNSMIPVENDIKKVLTDVEVMKTKCEGTDQAVFGIPFAVAVISQVQYIPPDNLVDVMEKYATIIYDRWDVLSSDNGILLFVSCIDALSYTKFGPNTERSVLPNYIDKIGKEGLANFTGSDCYQGGIVPKLELYRDVASGNKEYFCEAVVSKKMYNGVVAGLIIFAIAFIVVAVIFALWRKNHQKPKTPAV